MRRVPAVSPRARLCHVKWHQNKRQNDTMLNIGTNGDLILVIFFLTDNICLHELAFVFGDATGCLAANLQTHISRFLQIQQLLKELFNIVVGLR